MAYLPLEANQELAKSASDRLGKHGLFGHGQALLLFRHFRTLVQAVQEPGGLDHGEANRLRTGKVLEPINQPSTNRHRSQDDRRHQRDGDQTDHSVRAGQKTDDTENEYDVEPARYAQYGRRYPVAAHETGLLIR